MESDNNSSEPKRSSLTLDLTKPVIDVDPAPRKPIVVRSGSNRHELSRTEGETITVGSVRAGLSEVLNIAPTAIAVVGEDEVDDDKVLNDGDDLQFIKRSGTKG
jgi:hypothetical protein